MNWRRKGEHTENIHAVQEKQDNNTNRAYAQHSCSHTKNITLLSKIFKKENDVLDVDAQMVD